MANIGRSKAAMMAEVDPPPDLVSLQDALKAALADVRTLKAQIGDDRALFSAIRSSLEPLDKYPRMPIPKPQLNHSDSEAVLILTDAHSEELVRPEEMEGLAAHNWETHESRMAQCAEKTVELVNIMRQAGHVRNLVVYLLGDWFLGEIHADELLGASMSMPRALPRAGIVLANSVLRMAAYFDAVRVVGIVGNHGRNTRKPVYKMATDRNWDMSVYLIAEHLTAQAKNVSWVLPQSLMHVDDVMGWKNLLTHGNMVNITHRTPWFGIEDSFNKQHNSRRGTDKDFDYAYMGHLHHFGCVLHGEVTVCPSLIGRSQFGQYRMHSGTGPEAMLLFYNEKHGCTCPWRIKLY